MFGSENTYHCVTVCLICEYCGDILCKKLTGLCMRATQRQVVLVVKWRFKRRSFNLAQVSCPETGSAPALKLLLSIRALSSLVMCSLMSILQRLVDYLYHVVLSGDSRSTSHRGCRFPLNVFPLDTPWLPLLKR